MATQIDIGYGGPGPGAPGVDSSVPPRPISYFDDFIVGGFVIDAALANETDPSSKFSNIADSGEWLVTYDVAPTIVIADAEPGGLLVVTTGSNANDFCSCQMNGQAWAVTALKDIYFEARIKLDDTDDTQWFLGLCSTDVAGTTLGPILDSVGSNGSMIGFVQDGDTDVDIDYIVQNGGTATQADTLVNVADDTYVTLAFQVLSAGAVNMFVNGVLVANVATNIPVNDALTLSMEVHSPTASSTLEVDYILCSQSR